MEWLCSVDAHARQIYSEIWNFKHIVSLLMDTVATEGTANERTHFKTNNIQKHETDLKEEIP